MDRTRKMTALGSVCRMKHDDARFNYLVFPELCAA